MFVKKDLRKIPEILADATARASRVPLVPPSNDCDQDAAKSKTSASNDESNAVMTEISFARRAPEFLPSKTVSLLLQPQFLPALQNLICLSLYDCGLVTLAGIEFGGQQHDKRGAESEIDSSIKNEPIFPNLQQLDIGRNPLITNSSLPATFSSQLPSLLELWCDDCSFGPQIPQELLNLHKLRVVRMTKNKLQNSLNTDIGIKYWPDLRTLALDGNQLTEIGEGIGLLEHLEVLLLRQNELREIPEKVPSVRNGKLKMVSLSSNRLEKFPVGLAEVKSNDFGDGEAPLREVYLNGNKIEQLPSGIWGEYNDDGKNSWLRSIKKLNLAHNSIGSGINNSDDVNDGGVANILPKDFVERFGMPDPSTGECINAEGVIVRLEGNPLVELLRKKWIDEQRKKERDEKEEMRRVESETVDGEAMDVDE
ncbi:hypothetical protein ACHAXS_007160 [Conticribra weissflogii]